MNNFKIYLTAAVLLLTITAFSQEHSVNTESSTIKWVGKKVGGAHDGHIKLKSGIFNVDKNSITSGKFVVDMTTITCDDLSGAMNKKLVGHLKSDDFFDVEKYAVAKLTIIEGGTFKDGKANVKGKLTIKDKTNPVDFVVTKSGSDYTTTVVVDRSQFDVRYGSKSFFSNLGDKYIEDKFTLEINISTK